MGHLLRQSIYLALLRAVFLLSIAFSCGYLSLLMEEEASLVFIALFSSILVHQIVYAFKVPFLCDNAIDIIWIFCDIVGLVIYTINMFGSFIFETASQIVTQEVVSVVLTTLYILLLFARVYLRCQAINDVEKRPFNLREMGGIGILFGESLWKTRLIGETKRLILARGILASSLLAGIVAFFYVSIFTGAFQELQFIPTQNTRTADKFIPYPDLLDAGVWGVTFKTISGIPNRSGSPNITAAVKVVPLWDDSSPNNTRCELVPEEGLFVNGYDLNYAVSFACPPRLPTDTDYFETTGLGYNGNYQPDLLVTVDFDALGIPSNSTTNIALNSIQVMVRMTNDTADVLDMTRPTVLTPGVNMVGMVSMEIHQTFKNPGVATLGLFEHMKSTLVGQVTQLYPDQSSTSPRGPNISTLRLSVVREVTQWAVIRDFKNNSFLSGFSKVGGLWTFLSGVFGAIFGSSLMRVLFGNKPISVFGFAHRWERDAIGKAYRARYPAMRDEMTVSPEQRGLLCLIQDHIVDLNLIDRPDLDECDSNELTALQKESDSSTPLIASAV